jgi:hypothetical protein
VVECQLPKLDVDGSNPFARFENMGEHLPTVVYLTHFQRLRDGFYKISTIAYTLEHDSD